MISIDYNHCTGCEACVQICSHNSISLSKGEFGFLYPEIDMNKCVNCRLCEKVCSINTPSSVPTNQKAYATIHKDSTIVLSSTSGGAFSGLATAVLNKDGIVYGASMDDFIVQHIRIESIGDLNRLRGSKYVQSRIGCAFKNVEQDLKSGREVLFSGTPCQIAALRTYLGRTYDNLLSIDIICHGVASQEYFTKYVNMIKNNYPDLKEIQFRSKEFSGWSCGSGAFIIRDQINKELKKPFYSHRNYYYQYFLSGDIFRKSCYSCKYANLNRPGDITLGDFWGIEKMNPSFNTYNGCSLVIVNNENGQKAFETISALNKIPVNIEFASKYNAQLTHPSPIRETRKKRIEEFDNKTGAEIDALYRAQNKIKILKGDIKTLIPYRVKRILRKLM